MFSFINIKNKIKRNRGLDIDKQTLYSYLLLGEIKYKLKFSIFLLTADQNTYSICPVFLILYKNRIIPIPINANYYDLMNNIATKEKLPLFVIVKLNDIIFENRELFLQYYKGSIGRIDTIKNFKP